ncbi:MAG: DUF4198 domain-containing protein [Pseudomonadota bacterium]
MKKLLLGTVLAGLSLQPAAAHFGMIIPSDPIFGGNEDRMISATFGFAHPFEAEGMVLEAPLAAQVTVNGASTDIDLTAATVLDAPGFVADIEIARPGAHILSMVPQPYWEPAEDVFIQHFTKTYVAAYSDDSGWDAMLGFPVEIEPLSRPFAQWAGNMFQGVVTQNGEPVPFAEVEVEFYSPEGALDISDELFVTQSVKADGNGVFSYVAPWGGWWGFAALMEGPDTIAFDGEEKAVEQGAVIWVNFEEAP